MSGDGARIGVFDAVILAGGRGSRLGEHPKPAVEVGGRRLLDIALSAASGARERVVVGHIDVPDGVLVTCEEPPFGGPVAGVAAGLEALRAVPGRSGETGVVRTERAPWTLLLASDLPGAESAVEVLVRARPADHHDGVCLAEPDGRLQWLLGLYRTDVLERRWAERGDPPITAMYRMLEPLDLLGVPCDPRLLADVDTPADLARALQETP